MKVKWIRRLALSASIAALAVMGSASAQVATLEGWIDEATAQRILQNLPHELVVATMQSLAAATMELTALNPARAAEYREAAFGIFWSGITKKK